MKRKEDNTVFTKRVHSNCHETFYKANSIFKQKSRVFLLRQLWIINYYVKSSLSNVNDESINTGVSREMIFQK